MSHEGLAMDQHLNRYLIFRRECYYETVWRLVYLAAV